ncbi:D-amino-acid transaminase [Inquilinus sp. CAU 1745]|uniref:D-amino-acid transaminase n=1 Tax=Inquilinus sp. CAU 1745 TaxID=3140369 RepID=UPI00325BD9D4
MVYVGDRFVAEDEATLSIFDRGLLFGDSIYEVTAVIGGRMIDNDLHLARLAQSLGELGIRMPLPREAIVGVQMELIARNRLDEGVVYLQVTRGVADRNFAYADDLEPTFFAFSQAKNLLNAASVRDGVRIAVVDDQRWARRDIKTTMLLAQVQAKRIAAERGCQEAWMVEDGLVTEGASSTAYIVTADGRIVTRPNSRAILPGCTRRAVLAVAKRLDLVIEESPFTVEEAVNAQEAFLTSASSLVTPVIEISGRAIGDGKPGSVTRLLQRTYLDLALSNQAAAQ